MHRARVAEQMDEQQKMLIIQATALTGAPVNYAAML